jgi:hypothetical protein
VDLTGSEDEAIPLGSIAPPANNYCGMTAELIKADDDTQNLPTTPDMVGLSIYLQGEYLASGGSDWVSFEISSGKSLLPAQRIFSLPMQLSSEQLNGSVTLQLPYSEWFDGVDFTQINTSTQIDSILFNISSSISLL